jgi:phosphatidylglycerophosphate synthase
MEKLFYIPNMIGFLRIFLLITSAGFYSNVDNFTVFYILNFVLDGLDGYTARALKQETKFGYALDMITDRIGSALLYIMLIEKTQTFKFFFILCLFLDISSHWFATLQGKKTHKSSNENPVLSWYYKPMNLCLTCVCNELFLLSLNYWSFTVGQGFIGRTSQIIIQSFLGSFFVLKTGISFVQLIDSCSIILNQYDEKRCV